MTTIDQIIIEWFNTGFGGIAPDWVGNLVLFCLSIFLTIVFAGIIGYEREYYGHASGLRTHTLVAVGSAIAMMISIYGFAAWDAAHPGASRDPARIAAQVVTGIGFLGAGTILRTGSGIKGLTTATTIWIVMAIGMACGSGNFVIATIGTGFAFLALVFMKKIEEKMRKRNPTVVILLPSDKAIFSDLVNLSNRHNIVIIKTDSALVDHEGEKAVQITLTIKYTPDLPINAFLDDIRISLKPFDLKSSTEH